MADDLVIVGTVGKAVGLRGDVHVHPDPDIDEDFAPGAVFRADLGALTVVASRVHAGRRIVRFEEASDRQQAEALRGTLLQLAREDIALDDGAVWISEVIGRDVRDGEGALIGVVERVLDAPAHDLLVIARPDGGEALVPVVEELVEIGEDFLVVHVIPGLLDVDAVDEG